MQIKTETIVGLFVLSAVAIFIYMSLQIGALRFDCNKYSPYLLYFPNVSGLNTKVDVKIAGVKVGWVEALALQDAQVKVTILVAREYQLHSDAQAIVRQDGLLGGRYLEIMPGNSLLPCIPAGGAFTQQNREPVALDEILYQFKKISANIEEVSCALKNTFGGAEGAARIGEMVQCFNNAAQQFAAVSARVDTLLAANTMNVQDVLHDIQQVAAELKTRIPAVAKPLQEVAQKINEGNGMLGQLVNDQDIYCDIKTTVQGIKNFFSKVDKIAIIVDSHWESMYNMQTRTCFRDGKGFFNFRIHPADDYFYLVGLATASTGRIRRYEEHRSWQECNGTALIPEQMNLTNADKLKYAQRRYRAEREFDTFSLNLQFGKIYRDIAIRFGLFEGCGGVAIDYDVPLGLDWFRWVTTFEAFDFRGRNRFNDSRPHLKWLNKIYVTNHLYFAVGADDFISKNNKNLFFGAGLRFSDDDIKYFLSKFSAAGS